MRSRVLFTTVVLAAMVALPSIAASPARADPAPTSFTFGAAGDFGAGANASATLNTLAGAGTDFFLALGDLSYGQVTPESAWCNFVKSRVGATYPFELVAGNHEATGGESAIANFAACLPDRLGGVVGSYAKEGYVDYPQSQPLARFITISPNLSFPGEATYAYKVGSAHYTWLSNAIDGARANGIRWVIVGMHEVCMTAGSMSCQIGADLQNLLVGKKVDLVLQGHEHGYQRSKQLALGPSCPSVPVGSFQVGCVVDDGSDNNYAKGAGTVIVIAATGGAGLVSVNAGDSEAPYFAKLMGSNTNPTQGFMKYTVSSTQLSATFVRSARGNFTDSFTIGAAANTPPAADSLSATTSAGIPLPLTLRGTDAETCELTFSVVTGPTHGALSALADQPCTTGNPNQDGAGVTYTPATGYTGPDSFTYRVNDGSADSAAATVSLTVNPPPGAGISFQGASAAQNPTSTSLTIAKPAGAAGDVLVAAVAVRGTTTITPPPGWTFMRLDNAANYTIQAVYYRVVSSSEPTSYQWTFSSSNAAAGGILDYRGVNTSSPIDVQGGAVTGTATTSIVAPSITTTVSGARVVGLFGIGGANSITPPAGMTEDAEAASTAGSLHVTWEGSDFTQATAGATGTKTAGATVAHPNVGQLVALRPA